MPLFEFTLTGFKFPKNLDNDKANFRFVVDLRFINDESRFTTEHAVMPSLDTFWECDQGGEGKPNYVRGEDAGDYGQFNMNDNGPIDEWDRLILHVKGKSVHSIQFKVIDVNRRDAWDKVKDFLGGIIEAVIGQIKDVIPQDLPLSLPGSLGGAADDLHSFLLKKLAGGDNVLFRGSAPLKALEDGNTMEFTVPENLDDPRSRGNRRKLSDRFQSDPKSGIAKGREPRPVTPVGVAQSGLILTSNRGLRQDMRWLDERISGL